MTGTLAGTHTPAPSVDRVGATGPVAATGGTVVLVDPLATGAGFKTACIARGLLVTGVYTLPPARLAELDADYTRGDTVSVHTTDVAVAAAQLPPDVRAVVATSEPSVPFADALAEALGLPGNPVRTSLARRDKVAMRALAVEARVRVPLFRVVDVDAIRPAVNEIGYPAIVKPPAGAGAHGVHLVRTPAELDDVLQDLEPLDLFGRPVGRRLVEQYVRGRELAVNAFTVDSRHTVIDVWEYRQPGSADYDQPYWDLIQLDADDPDLATAREFVRTTLDAYDVRVGPSHTEIKIGPDGPVLIETASRLPGAHMADQWELHGGIHPYADVLRAFLGENPGPIARGPRFDAALAIVCVPCDRDGHLVAIHGLDEVAALPGVDRVFVNCPPGRPVTPTTGLDSVPVVVLVHAPDPSGREQVVTAVRRAVRLEIA